MCGLSSLLGPSSQDEPVWRSGLAGMYPRGQHGQGVWGESGIPLGHRRFAILDLDNRVAQPSQPTCGRYAIVFNGEISRVIGSQAWAKRVVDGYPIGGLA